MNKEKYINFCIHKKMNKLFLLLFALFVSCKSPSQNGKTDNSDIIELKQAYTEKNEKKFLENFPSDFTTFKNTFGWDDVKDSEEPLYKDANNYIDYWFSLIKKTENKNYELQIISICKNGKWEADAVNYFQKNVINYIKNNKKYYLIDSLLKEDAKSVLTFLFDSPHPKENSSFISNLNAEKQAIAKSIFSENISTETKRSSLVTYENNKNYFIKTFDVNKDGIQDKIVSSKAYQGEDLFVFLGNKVGSYMLNLETKNFSEDGGNIIENIYPLKNERGFMLKTYFPDRGYYEKEYYLIPKNNTWFLRNIIYKTMSDNSENAVKYICDVPQNLDITKSGWSEKINLIPDENERSKKCKVEENSNTNYSIRDSDGYTNLRKEKNTTSEVLQKVKSGEQVDVLDQKGNWWLIQIKDGKKGYVHKSRVKSN